MDLCSLFVVVKLLHLHINLCNWNLDLLVQVLRSSFDRRPMMEANNLLKKKVIYLCLHFRCFVISVFFLTLFSLSSFFSLARLLAWLRLTLFFFSPLHTGVWHLLLSLWLESKIQMYCGVRVCEDFCCLYYFRPFFGEFEFRDEVSLLVNNIRTILERLHHKIL